ncbi:pyridoxamine 5'-phosphate oxidase family protein [Microbacterium protaetiae]|uniref:Pyridoxamine 5'-phosphate oxidase family protein n=1 Tax=Microbacterium protaetiae TaxID=2509458 RepID=A0A4P6EGW5_9MICO|nr:pyridoxamine 5'-phosphate oxidase family protein [Microbacterium protaetiae]QAY60409.1 pyridoxamine 5'-phosphate oxidase family protein [Microbacterium protaetiae]
MGTVDINAVAEHARAYGFAYLITITKHQRVHTSVVHPEFTDHAVTIPGASDRARTNAGAHPDVSLVWPPPNATGYSLIVDGTADGQDAAALRIAPSRAILHRPATEPTAPGAGDGCVQDCIEL